MSARTSHYDRSFNKSAVLSEDDLRRVAPSIFAVDAHESRSARFVPIPTIEVVNAMRNEGFEPVRAVQCRTRDEGKREFTKHMIRFRRMDVAFVEGTTAEVILVNANDGSSAYKLMAGIYRLICANGMVIMDNKIDDLKVRHGGRAIDDVIEGSYRVLSAAEAQLVAPDEWSKIALTSEMQLAFAESARLIRFGDKDGNADTPIQAHQLLSPRRSEDAGSDLWRTFNRVQENAVRGGLSARRDPVTDPETGRVTRGRMTTTRQIAGIDQDVKVNKALWQLGEEMARILSYQSKAA